jgi:low affinity Fe/Cu permease
MLSIRSKKTIGLIGAIVVFVIGIVVLIIMKPFNEQWNIGLVFVIISIIYFIVAVFLKSYKK